MEAFLARRSSASAQPLAGTATREQRQADAARVGLAVSAAKRGIGRPPRQALYEDALRDAIRAGTLPAEVTSTAAPDWWRAGLPLTRAQHQQAEDLLEAVRVPAGQAENAEALEGTLGPSEEGNQPATDTDAGQPHRKKYKAAPPEAKAWFLQYARLQSDLHRWSFDRSFRHAQAMAPDIFGHVHKDVPRRWKAPPALEMRGRVARLSPGALAKLAEAAAAVTAKLPMAS